MSGQSSYIAAALLGGFVLYLAAKGRLPTYAAVLWGPTAAAVPSGGSATSGTGSVLGTVAGVLGGASSVGDIANFAGAFA